MKKEKNVFNGGKRKYTTCTFILKVFMRSFDQSERSRNSFCFEALALGHTSSSLSFGETEDRFIFCIRLWFLLQYPPPPPLLWDLPEKSSPNRVVPVLEGGLRRRLLLFHTSLHVGQEILTESSADPEATSGAVVNCVDP